MKTLLPYYILLCVYSCFFAEANAYGEKRFDGYEIRVIRPRYFSKAGRFELGAQFQAITNQTFVYSYLFGGSAGFHLSESFGFEMEGTYGLSVDKEDTLTLDQGFNIKTQILRTQYNFTGNLMWSPIYGKYQLSSGDVMYFDTYFSAGAGVTGVNYLYDHCNQTTVGSESEEGQDPIETPIPKTVPYPGGSIGGGQRLYLSKKTAVKWSIKDYFFTYNTADGACFEGAEPLSKLHHNIVVNVGISKFF